MQDVIVILEEGNRLYLLCPNCELFVSQQAFPFPLLTLLVEGSDSMPDIQCLLGHEHFTVRAAEVEPVALLQDNNDILHVLVEKVNQEVGLDGRHPLASCHWSMKARERRREGN